ncbi:hypothetical protein MKD33_19820, partial [Chromobacterium piscinae]
MGCVNAQWKARLLQHEP